MAQDPDQLQREQEAERLLRQNADIFNVRLVDSRADFAWTAVAIAALATYAVEISIASSPFWGGLIAAVIVFVVTILVKTFRFKGGAVAAQVRLGGGLIAGGACLLALGPRPVLWVSVVTMLIVGAAKGIREMIAYSRIKKRMQELGKNRKVRMLNFIPGAFGFLFGGIALAFSISAGNGPDLAMSAWLVSYSLLYAAFELWG